MKKLVFSSCLLSLSLSLFGQHSLSGQSDHQGLLDKQLNKVTGESPYLSKSSSSSELEKDRSIDVHQSSFLPGVRQELSISKSSRETNAQPPLGTIPQSEQMLEFRATDLFEKIENSGKDAITLAYYRMYYKVQNSTYNDIFAQGKSRDLGGLFVHYDDYLWRPRFFQLGYSLGLGVHFQSGRGHFSSGDSSATEFKLWTIPLDAHLAVGVPIWKLGSLYLSGGPAAMALMQNRNDFESNEKGKNLNQISYGYSARGQLRISTANLMRKSAVRLYRELSVSNSYLNFEARYDHFSQFQQDDISISGASFGIGFTFDFI